MSKRVESGRSRFVKGSLLYLWEEIKTMNVTKFKALYRIGTGYLKMKLASPKKNQKRIEHARERRGYIQ